MATSVGRENTHPDNHLLSEGNEQQSSTLLEVKLDGLQSALETLEGRFELKEQEVSYLNQLA